MKKSRFIVGILVMAIMLMGAGYAAWTQGFTVTNTVNTGELLITAGISNLVVDDDRYMSAIDDDMEVVISDLYPGGSVTYDVTFKNEGTLAAKLEEIPSPTFYDEGGIEIPSGLIIVGATTSAGDLDLEVDEELVITYTVTLDMSATDIYENLTDVTAAHNYNFIQFNM